jgi:hypothetical protein
MNYIKSKEKVVPYKLEDKFIKPKNNNEKQDNLGKIREFTSNDKKYIKGNTINIFDENIK